MTVFKIFLICGLIVVARTYMTQARSPLRDRAVVLAGLAALVAAVIYPDGSSWVAHRLGIERGTDLASYVGFLLLFFLVGAQRLRLKEQERALTELVQTLALQRAQKPERPAPHA
jgi:small membrane protein